MDAFLKFILVLILIWFGFTLFIRYIFPRLLLYWIKRKQKKMMEQMGLDPDKMNDRKKKEGEVNITPKAGKTKKGSTDELGEYVDFEEVDD
ncbi:MAG: hypothetical protein AVO34_06320 [Firmicutes bacterium ML8_F2]|jgi:hypothetical protein|nr:MAG: hypothetical protein AVO34_06320 [Firmicutes bacterium ML8_F2]